MASQDRAAADSLMHRLLSECKQFSFFQAVRLLERLHPQSVALGREGPAEREAIRFRPSASLAFPTCDVEELELSGTEGDQLPRFLMTVNFLGLYGPASPLPTFYTEDILSADLDESNRRQFLDLFHHRLIALLYRCWEKYRYYALYQPGATDQFSQWMFALIGLGDAALRDESSIQWPRLLPYLGLLGMKSRSASVLARVISHYFGGLPAQIEQCVARWVPLATEQRTRLGAANCALGIDSLLGDRVYDRSGKFAVHIGPVDFATFCKFLPPGEYYHTVRELIVFGLTDRLAYDVEVTLLSAEIPPLELVPESPCRLGWSTWLGSGHDHDVAVNFPGTLGQ
jgi:type VI secretion system protein ImpH